MIDIEAIAARADAATPGPWRRHDTRDYAEIHNGDSWGKAMAPIALVGDADDADFIAHAREDIPALLTHIAELTARAEKAEAKLARAVEDIAKYATNVHTCKFGKDCAMAMCNHEYCFNCNAWQYRGEAAE